MTTWHDVIGGEKEKEYFHAVRSFEQNERNHHKVFPAAENVFKALELTPFDNVKVVILGQDPYHGDNQAHGLSFSVQKGIALPPSLLNIYKELESDLGIPVAKSGDLTAWAKQGVLLLNTVLTVRAHEANSHRSDHPIAFVLWGKPAQSKEKLITNPSHLILKSPHPSPLSSYRGFFGSKPFSQINAFLEKTGQEPIDWRVE